jgi:hypothetical protein
VASNSSKLWKSAENEWEETKRDNEVLTYTEFAEEWNKGNISDIDEYEKLSVVGCRHANLTATFQLA